MRYLNFKDKRLRNCFVKKEIQLYSKLYFKNFQKLPFFLKKFNFRSRGYRSEIQNRCILSFRSRSVYKCFKLSRQFLRFNLSFGFITGFRKAGW